MALLDRLVLQGVRSFGPEETDRATIKFSTPLTLILGENGCGKTTIIESLKYVICGELPGNTKSGSGFVHDPKLGFSCETRAKLQLKLNDIKGQTMVVTRVFQSVQKQKKLEFQATDQTISRKENGERISISGKCIDVNKEMCLSLGASKAILNYVIFCHQEDSNWPLDEGKKLKERFDAIFDAVKYNKCLDHIKKLQKSYKDKLNTYNLELNYLMGYKKNASDKRINLKELESRLAANKDNISNFKSRKAPIMERLDELAVRENEIMKLHTEHETLKTKMEGVRNTINDYKAAISFVFGGTDVELEQAIENFQQGLCEKQKLIETLEREEENVVREQKRHQLLISEEQKKLGQLMRDLERNREKIAERNSAMIKLCEDLSIATSHAHLSEVDEVARVISSIEQAVRHNNNSVLSLKTKQEQEVAELQKGIYNLRDDRAKLLQVIENKKSALAQNKEDLIKVKGDIQEVDQSAEMLGRLQTKLDRVKKELDDINQNTDIESLENEIKQADKEREMHEDNLTIIQGEIDQLQTLSNIQAELDIQKSNKSRKEAEIQKLTARHKDSLKHLLKEVPEQGIKFRLQACIDRLADEITSKKAEAKSLEHKIATLEIEKTHLSEKLMSAKRSHESDECAITEACKGKDYESYLLELSNKVQELQDHKGTLSSSEYMFRRYVQKLQQNKPCCPLCHRNFSAEDEVVKLISELSLKVRELPTKLRTNKQQLDVTQEEYRNLLQLKPKFDRLSTLSNSEIPGIQSSLEAVDRKLETANEKLALIQAELVSPQTDETLAKSIQGDIILLEQYISECKQISRDIQKIESKLPSGKSSRTLKEAMNERNNAQACFQNARQTVEKLQTKKNDLMTKRHRLQEEKNKIQDQQMRISGNTQMRAQLSERQKELESLEVIMQMELDKYMEDSAKVVNQLEQSSRQMRARLASNADELDRLTKKVRNHEQCFEDIRKLHNSIGEYENTGGSTRLTATQERLTDLERKCDILQDKKYTVCQEKDQLKDHLANQKIRERELVDNRKLRQKIKEEEDLGEKIAAMNLKIGNLDFVSLEREKNMRREELQTVLDELGKAEGRKIELLTSITSLKAELNKDEIKNADKNYRDKLIIKTVTEEAAEDLNRYHRAMEWSLMNFHQERMKNINDIIDDLWRQIYRGNDIDTIKIIADNIDGGSGGEKRRTYNYRVVQVRKDVELELRGRCSAGQKVLACLIIRMALAETFSSNCGVLALDEPTTNLDEKNIESLSYVLTQIVTKRMQQKNFQLILITHDNNFLNMLTRLDEINHYYEVKRNEFGKSVIEKVVLK